MRSELIAMLLAVAGCAKQAQIDQCYPVSSWAAPVFKCAVAAAPAPAPAPIVEAPPAAPPEPAPPKVEVKEEKIELSEKVNFEFAKAELLPQSKTLLDDVAKALAEHPEIEKIRIEGHTDNDASNLYNMRLSQKRAAAVRSYLISKGIEAGRMESQGFGEDKPVADNATEEGREQNRRVEIHILKRKTW
jgi:outer membrane protein OmpA-like peptidoglycan-associated protein